MKKMVAYLKSVKPCGMHQSKKTSKEIVENTKNGLKAVQCIIVNWKDRSQEPLFSRKMCSEMKKQILKDCDRRRFGEIRLEKTTAEVSLFISES